MGHFIPLNLTSVAILSPARPNMNSLTWQPVKAGVEESLAVRVKGASSSSYKVVASRPCSIQGGDQQVDSTEAKQQPWDCQVSVWRASAAAEQCEGEKCVQRRPHSPEATGRETACSNLLRARTKYTELQREGCRLCYTQRVSALTSRAEARA